MRTGCQVPGGPEARSLEGLEHGTCTGLGRRAQALRTGCQVPGGPEARSLEGLELGACKA
jgi:hypothetical protein